jgi:hypothetical protein
MLYLDETDLILEMLEATDRFGHSIYRRYRRCVKLSMNIPFKRQHGKRFL